MKTPPKRIIYEAKESPLRKKRNETITLITRRNAPAKGIYNA
jgi:hypothetical protein